jgi:two-component system nitrate/nitrite response regulator NarL
MSAQTVSPIDQAPRRVRILLVDDMPQVRHDLRQLLELTGLVEIVAEASDGLEAARLAKALAPEAVVMDLEMPGLDGYEATRRIKSQSSAVRVIILSVHAGPEEVERAQAAGADGFVVKGASYETLMRAILNPAALSSTGEADRHA